MCEATISMAMFNSYVKLPEGIRYTCAYIYIYIIYSSWDFIYSSWVAMPPNTERGQGNK